MDKRCMLWSLFTVVLISSPTDHFIVSLNSFAVSRPLVCPARAMLSQNCHNSWCSVCMQMVCDSQWCMRIHFHYPRDFVRIPSAQHWWKVTLRSSRFGTISILYVALSLISIEFVLIFLYKFSNYISWKMYRFGKFWRNIDDSSMISMLFNAFRSSIKGIWNIHL